MLTVRAATLGECWLQTSAAILAERARERPTTGSRSRRSPRWRSRWRSPTPDDPLIARLGGSGRGRRGCTTTSSRRSAVAELGDARSYASRLFDYGRHRPRPARLGRRARLRDDPDSRSATSRPSSRSATRPISRASRCSTSGSPDEARRARRLRPQPRLRQEGLREPRRARAPPASGRRRARPPGRAADRARQVGARVRARVGV